MSHALPIASPDRFQQVLKKHGLELFREGIHILQLNLGKLCNQSCRHCHVEAGPKRTELMNWATIAKLLLLLEDEQVHTVDLTGGAPEMNPNFAPLVKAISTMGKKIIVRCNLTITQEPGYEWLVKFYAQHKVHLVCSLPCYEPENVGQQRGEGVFAKSIQALQALNGEGYGKPQSALGLDLVYNPQGTNLPPTQVSLEAAYRKQLADRYGIQFHHLLTLTNMPIGRFSRDLARKHQLDGYYDTLEKAFNPHTVPELMCRNTLNVSWDGKLYDCDFNQMLNLPIPQLSIDKLLNPSQNNDPKGLPIQSKEHCLGCTAGSGSSCGGALV